MSTKSDDAAPRPDASGSVPAAGDGKSQDPIPRRLYVIMRLEEIAAEVRDMAEKRKALGDDLAASSASGETAPKNQRDMRERRAYLAQRLAIVRKEQADLHLERKALGAAERETGGKQNKPAGPVDPGPTAA